MPNVVIVGYLRDGALNIMIRRVEEILGRMDLETAQDAIVTGNLSTCKSLWTGRSDLYLIVRDTNMKRGEKVAEHLCNTLQIDVELEILHMFFSRPTENPF
jgi:hypothetical protein